MGPFLCLLLLSLAAPAAAGEQADLFEVLQADGRFRTLVAALERADRVALLQGEGPLTLFAPTDEAFAALPEATRRGLFAEGGKAALQRVLAHHLLAARVSSKDLLATSSAATVAGTRLPIRLRVGEARVTQADIPCRNGILHVIDRVLLPPAKASPAAATASSAEALQILYAAIQRGTPLFNQGDIPGCATVYDEAAAKVLGTEGALPAWDRMRLAAVRAEPHADAAAQAWASRSPGHRPVAK
ncbi:MAG: fasciclin domain-containing protein, partial [Planctomycetota bacterium]|nr:fasciclin domain-containing protein [Planctomycetota bacterium]